MGVNVLLVIFDVISISLVEGIRDTVQEMRIDVFVIVNFAGVEEGSAEAKVHSSSAGACVVCAGGGGAVKLSRRFDGAAGGGAACEDWNWKGDCWRGVWDAEERAAKGSGLNCCC
jgi:hypothetical protein